jgi:Bacterial Ig domain/Calx-beta domain/Lamin Tail Domain
MKYKTPSFEFRVPRAFAAALLSFLTFVSPLAPLSALAADDRARRPSADAEAGQPPAGSPAEGAYVPMPAPMLLRRAPGISATKTDAFPDPNSDGKAAPGETITYTVTITNSGPDPATGVQFNDTPDPNTTLVPGSITTQPVAQNDTASAFGNVRIATTQGAPNLLANDCDPDPAGGACTNTGLTASGPTTSANNGNVTVSANGDFTYNPFPGFTGTDSFTYTVTDGTGKTDTATMTITVGPTLIWFINNSAASNGDGRITSPFNSIANFNAGAADDAGDIIFLHTGTGTYTGGFTLLNTQKLIGQGFALQTETGAPPAGSDTLPTAGAAPTIDNPGSNIITLGQNNTLRGFNTGNSGAAGTDISGTSFGTLTVSALAINGDGRALNLVTGTLAATIANISASNTGSNAGLVLNAVGGALTVSGSTTITNPGGTGIDKTNSPSGTNHDFGLTVVNKNSTSGIGVNIAASVGTTTFTTLTVTTQNGFALNTNGGGTVNAAGGSLTQSGAGGGAASLTNTQLGLTFTSVSSNGGGNGILINGGDGTFTSGTTNLQNNAGVGLSVSGSSVACSFGNTTVNSSAGDAVDLATNGDSITFADLDMTPDAGLRGLDATGNTGTITVTSGDITTSGGATASAVFVDGPAGRTPINLTFTTVTTSGVGNTTNGASVSLIDVSGTKFQVTGTTQVNTRAGHGVFVDNSTATNIQFATVNVPNPNAAGGHGIHVEDSTSTVLVATATISDANTVTGQTDGNNDAIPDNDGDGDAIFLKNNTGGSFTLNGGTLSNCGNDCVDVRDSVNLTLSGVTMNTPGVDASGATGAGFGGHGIQAINLTGTSTVTGCTISNVNVAARDFSRFINNVAAATTLTIKSSNFTTGGVNSSNGVLVRGRNSANMTVTIGGAVVGDANTFTGLYGAGVDVAAEGSSTVNPTIRHNTFQNAAANGLNTVAVQNAEGGKYNTTISNNTFNTVARVASSNTGVITVNANGVNAGNNATINISNNTLSNIGNASAAVCGSSGNCTSYRGIQVFIDDQSIVTGNIVIEGNNVTNVRRSGLWLDIARGASGSNINARVVNNTFGTAAAPVGLQGQSGVSIFSRCFNGASNVTCTKTDNVLFSGNTVVNNSSSGSLETTVFARAEDDVNFQLTVSGGNNLTNQGTLAEFTARAAFPIGAGDTMCLDMTGNTLNAGAGNIVLTEDAGSTLNVEQASAAALAAANGIPAGNVAVNGAPTFGVACATPPANPSEGEGELAPPVPGGDPVEGAEPPPVEGGEPPPAAEQQAAQPAFVETASAARATEWSDIEPSRRNLKPAATSDPVYFGAASYSPESEARTVRASYTTEGERAAADSGPARAASAPVTARAARAMLMRDHNGTVHVNIGTLPAGDSVVITFQVTVNDPIPAGTTQVCNQGQTSGTNFSTVNTDDSGTGAAGDATCTPVQPPVDVTIKDATASEPPTAGAQNFAAFTVQLSQASGSTVTVSYATATGGANPATGGADCTTPGNDYKTTSGTLTFNPGQTVQTISVEICFDGTLESPDETFLVNLTGATNANVTNPPADNQAVGTITDANAPGEVLISELRTSGPGGTADDFVELYNNSDTPLTVNATDATSGWSIMKSGATCADTPVVVGTIPNGTVIPARGHYLLVGSAYSLGSYPAGSGTTATGNVTLTADIENDRNVGLFKTTNVANLSTATRVDSVGFGTNTGNNCDLLRESTTLANASGSTSEYSFARKLPLPSGKPQDTNVNATDFMIVSTTPATPVGDNAAPSLGAPGPENLSSPRQNMLFSSNFVDSGSCGSCSPNRVRDTTPGPAATSSLGTLSIRRMFTNNTGAPVTRLRYRIVDMTTFPSPTGFADLRAITSSNITVTKADSTMVTVTGTTLETPPAQPNGGGLNSTLSSGTITTATPLAAGASINVQFLLGVQQSGSFRFFVIIEALP